jgi:transposase
MPALVAIKYSENVKSFHQRLINNGKKPLQAIIAIMRKLILAIWGMFKSETIWKDEKFCNI